MIILNKKEKKKSSKRTDRTKQWFNRKFTSLWCIKRSYSMYCKFSIKKILNPRNINMSKSMFTKDWKTKNISLQNNSWNRGLRTLFKTIQIGQMRLNRSTKMMIKFGLLMTKLSTKCKLIPGNKMIQINKKRVHR